MRKKTEQQIASERETDEFADKVISSLEVITSKGLTCFGWGSLLGFMFQGMYSNHPNVLPTMAIRGAPFTPEVVAKQMFLTGTRCAWMAVIVSIPQQVARHQETQNATMIGNGVGCALASLYGSYVIAPSSVPVVATRMVLFSGLGVGVAYAKILYLKYKTESSTP